MDADWDRDALVTEVSRLAEVRAALWEATRGIDLSIDAICELNHLMFAGSFEEVVEVLKHVRTSR